MDGMVRRHPWVALLGFFPPVWLIGLIRTWGRPEYEVTLLNVWWTSVDAPGAPVWPALLYRRMSRLRR